jgi:hypothetical protein
LFSIYLCQCALYVLVYVHPGYPIDNHPLSIPPEPKAPRASSYMFLRRMMIHIQRFVVNTLILRVTVVKKQHKVTEILMPTDVTMYSPHSASQPTCGNHREQTVKPTNQRCCVIGDSEYVPFVREDAASANSEVARLHVINNWNGGLARHTKTVLIEESASHLLTWKTR